MLYCPEEEDPTVRMLYGPIASWRFGRSLGIDPLACREKRCPYSCLYCQYGPTGRYTVRRGIWASSERLDAELAAWNRVNIDWATFAGMGEPTLARNLAELLAVVRSRLQVPTLLLTCGAFLPLNEVRHQAAAFDAVAVKLDAPDPELYQRVNRPAPGLHHDLEAVLGGVRQFRSMYRGRFILQMMWVQANWHAASDLAAIARSLQPDEVQLDTPFQPALGGPLSPEQMHHVKAHFQGLPTRSIYQGRQAQIVPVVF
jgi:wyosine [tRNA(Phe)-imidazoG37] synthetase (radical SAM superfamily)